MGEDSDLFFTTQGRGVYVRHMRDVAGKLWAITANLDAIQLRLQPCRNKQVYYLCKTWYGRNSWSSKVLPDRINLVICLPVENRITIWTICSWPLRAKLSVPNKYSHVMYVSSELFRFGLASKMSWSSTRKIPLWKLVANFLLNLSK